MANMEPSAKRPFLSRFGGGYISAAQYLAEFSCERKAKGQGRGLLPRFWELRQWRILFRHQVKQANLLLEKYDWRAVWRAWEALPQTYSLASPLLVKRAAEEQGRLPAAVENAPPEMVAPAASGHYERPAFQAATPLLKKLRGL